MPVQTPKDTPKEARAAPTSGPAAACSTPSNPAASSPCLLDSEEDFNPDYLADYSSPDYSSPEYSSPDHSSPDPTSPDASPGAKPTSSK